MLSLLSSQLRSPNDIAVTDAQLLNIIIAFCDQTVDIFSMSQALFTEFGTLAAIIATAPGRLGEVPGMTDRLMAFLKFLHVFKMQSLRSAIPQPVRIADCDSAKAYLITRLRDALVEEFHVLFLDQDCHLISSDTLWRGTVDQVAAYPVEIARRTLQLGASKIVLVHNHPSRRTRPSQSDVDFTRDVIATCLPLNIMIEDHVIVAGDTLISLRQLGLLHPAGNAVPLQFAAEQ